MSDFKKLMVWQKAHGLMLLIDHTAAHIRGTRHRTLRTQMTRSAMSIPTNIVEGRGQKTDKEFARFLRISLNSTSELEYHLITAKDVRAISQSQYLSALSPAIEVRKMLHGLIATLEK